MTHYRLDIPTTGPTLTALPSAVDRVSMTGCAWPVLVGGRHPRVSRMHTAYRRRRA